jgi:hypothetical protein
MTGSAMRYKLKVGDTEENVKAALSQLESDSIHFLENLGLRVLGMSSIGGYTYIEVETLQVVPLADLGSALTAISEFGKLYSF